MKRIETRIKDIEEMLSPTPGAPITLCVTLQYLGAKPGKIVEERFDVVCRKVRGQMVTQKTEYPPVIAPENPEEFKVFMRQRREQALKESKADGR